jgi:hypothetical protein
MKPTLVVVSGASAGAIASPVVAGEVARVFPDAGVRQIGDGVAAIRVAQTRALLHHWAADSLMAALGLSLPPTGDALVGMYKAVGAKYPRIRFSQVSALADAHVALWLGRFGDNPANVTAYTRQTLEELGTLRICFNGYALEGTQHTMLWRPEVFETRVGNQKLLELLERDVLRRPCND